MRKEDPFDPNVVPIMSAAFLITLWLFLGSLTMLAVNEAHPGGVSVWEFVRGMIVWPWQLVQHWSEIRLWSFW